MADFDPLTIPAPLPESVPRVEQNGHPTIEQMQQEIAQTAWMQSNVASTNTRLNLVTDAVGGVSAAVETEAAARATADTALASTMTTVEAKANAATASGQVYLAAKAAPSGASAAYGWYLTAGNAYAGMQAMALSGGGSAIGFTANQFCFTDAGTAQAVFSYIGGGRWVLNGAMIIRSGASGERVEITNRGVYCYDGSGVLRVEIGFLT